MRDSLCEHIWRPLLWAVFLLFVLSVVRVQWFVGPYATQADFNDYCLLQDCRYSQTVERWSAGNDLQARQDAQQDLTLEENRKMMAEIRDMIHALRDDFVALNLNQTPEPLN